MLKHIYIYMYIQNWKTLKQRAWDSCKEYLNIYIFIYMHVYIHINVYMCIYEVYIQIKHCIEFSTVNLQEKLGPVKLNACQTVMQKL